jgi:hypothetical protein
MTDPNMTPDGELACAFGWPWLMHFAGPLFACPHCAAESARLIALVGVK